MGRDVGGMAESELLKWAHQVGITPNRALVDREAWDFLLQFPFSELTEKTTLDVRPSRIECLVQVKGLETPKTRKSLKLSNWEKLVRSLLPAFFLIIDFGKQDNPQDAYLVHVGEDWIGKVLHRLRELSSEDAESLNEKYLDLRWNQSHRLTELNGVGLMKAIELHIGDGMEEYGRRKIEIREIAGDPVPALMHVSTTFPTVEEGWSAMVDFAIGTREDLPTSSVVFEEDIRFDIPARQKRYDSEGQLQVANRPTTPINLIVRSKASTLRSEFPARLYSPHWFFVDASIPEQYLKRRVSFELGDIILYPSLEKGQVNLRFSQAKEFQSLREHANLWRLVDILHRIGTDDCVIEIEDAQGNSIGTATLPRSATPRIEEGLLRIAHAVDDLCFLARRFDISLDTKIALHHILQQQHTTRKMRQFCDVNFPVDRIEFEIETDIENPDEFGAAVPFLREVIFGSISVVAAVVLAGSLVRITNERAARPRFKIEKLRRIVVRHYVVQGEENEGLQRRLLGELSEELEEKNYIVVSLVGAG
jgi:hypothetical protein